MRFFVNVNRWMILVMLTWSFASYAAEITTTSKPSKNVDFEGSVVEGVNKQPFDSLRHISDKDGRRNTFLYTRKPNFVPENQQLLKEVGFAQ